MDPALVTKAEKQPKGPTWALLLSGLFHPLLIVTYMYVLLLLINPYLFGSSGTVSKTAMTTLVMLFLYTFVIPLISVVIMWALDMINSVMIEDRMQRIGPLLLVMVLYFWVTYNLTQSGRIPNIFSTFMIGVAAALSLAFVINVADKISLHTVGMGGLIGMAFLSLALFGGQGLALGSMTVSLGIVLIGTILLGGLVGTARLALNAHNKMQVYMGYMVGFLTQILAYLFYFQ